MTSQTQQPRLRRHTASTAPRRKYRATTVRPPVLNIPDAPKTFLRRQNPHQIRPICAKIRPNRINTCQNRRKSCSNRRKVDQNSAKARQNLHQPHPNRPDTRTICSRSYKFPKIHSATINTPPATAYAKQRST